MRIRIDGADLQVSDAVGAILTRMMARTGRTDGEVSALDLARARFDATTESAYAWGSVASEAALPLGSSGEVDMGAARQRFDAGTLGAWRWTC